MVQKIVDSERYRDGVRADALKALDIAATEYRNTLREVDEHDGNSTIADDDDEHASVTLCDDDLPEPWEVRSSSSKPCKFYSSTPLPARTLGSVRGPRQVPRRSPKRNILQARLAECQRLTY